MGRPSDFSQETANLICERMAQGQSLRQVCDGDDMPAYQTVLRWVDQREDFRDQYVRAREALFDWIAHEIIKISDDASGDYFVEDRDGKSIVVPDHARVQRARLQVDSRKWLLSKVAPRKYGDRPEVPTDQPTQHPLRIERVIIDISPEPPPPPPAQLTYDPGPIPSRMQAEIISRYVTILREHVPNADQRDPRELIDETMRVFGRAMQAKYGSD